MVEIVMRYVLGTFEIGAKKLCNNLKSLRLKFPNLGLRGGGGDYRIWVSTICCPFQTFDADLN